MREAVLDGILPGGELSRRAADRLALVRQEYAGTVSSAGLVVAPWDSGQVRWWTWTWAGARANGVLAAALSSVDPGLVDELDRYDNHYVELRGDLSVGQLPPALAAHTLSARAADPAACACVAAMPLVASASSAVAQRR